MAPHRTRWTLQIQSRREFLERGMMAAAWACLPACSSADLGAQQSQQNGNAPTGTPPAVTAYGPITPNEHFYITSCCGNPAVDATTWTLSITNRVPR